MIFSRTTALVLLSAIAGASAMCPTTPIATAPAHDPTDDSCSSDNQSCVYDDAVFWEGTTHPCAGEAVNKSFRCMCYGGYYTCRCRGDQFAKDADETEVEDLEVSGASTFVMTAASSLVLMGGVAALL